VGDGGAVPRPLHEPGGGQHRLPGRELPLRVCADRRIAPRGRPSSRTTRAPPDGDGGRGLGHVDRPDYPPGSYADTDELVGLSEEASRLGGIYHTHVRYSLGDRFLDPFREALEIGRRARIPAHITHFYQRTTAPGGAARMLGLVEDAREGGLDVTFDGYPYAYSSTRLNIVIPQWAFDGGLAALRRNLAAPEARARMKKEMGPRAASWHDMWVTHLKRPEHHRFEGRSIAEVAELMGLDVVDAICELLLLEDQQVSFVSAGANMATMPRFVSHPLYMVGSDAVLIGDYPSPRTYGAFPVILAEFVREERWLGLPDAIRKMTSFPAQRLGLPDRGLLRDGFKADVVVFDAQTVKAPATRREPKQFPIGIEQVIVNGRVVVDQGRHTGVLAGRALRRGRAAT
jgi:N-acyl-D-amino-acid deacylase